MGLLKISTGIESVNPTALDERRGPWASLAAARAGVPLGMRLNGLEVDIIGLGTYQWTTDLSDSGLLPKVSTAGTTIWTVTGTNTYTATVTGITAYTVGQEIRLKFTNTNTGAATVNINGLGAKPLQINGTAITSGQITANTNCIASYDGTNFQLIGLGSTSGSLFKDLTPLAGTTIGFIGDSVTTSSVTWMPDLTKRFSTVLCKKLGSIEDNQGAAGKDALWPIANNLVPTHTAAYSYLFIEFGINDLAGYGKTPAQFNTDLNTLIAHCTGTKGWPISKIIILSIPGSWYNAAPTETTSRPIIDQANTLTKATADSLGCTWINITDAFFDGEPPYSWSTIRGNGLYSDDNVHPNVEGNRLLSEIIFASLQGSEMQSDKNSFLSVLPNGKIGIAQKLLNVRLENPVINSTDDYLKTGNVMVCDNKWGKAIWHPTLNYLGTTLSWTEYAPGLAMTDLTQSNQSFSTFKIFANTFTSFGLGVGSTSGFNPQIALDGLNDKVSLAGTLNLSTPPATDNTITRVFGTNAGGDVVARDVSTISGGGGGVATFSAGTTGLTPSTATSGGVTLGGTLGLGNGGTGGSTAQAARNNIAGAVTNALYLRGNGTNVVMSAIQAADVPILNQSTTGSAATLTTARTIGTITGDATSAGSTFNGSANNTNALTLATVNANVGSFGTSTSVPSFTVNAKGLITAASATNIPTANTTTTGLLTNTDWNTFNSKQNAITLTTNGTSGVATLIGNTLNIPNYAVGGAGVTSLTGTANQINVSASTGAVNLSLPNTVITSGTIQSTTAAAGQLSGFYVNSSVPAIALNLTTGGADAKAWDMVALTNNLQYRTRNDANSSSEVYFSVVRSGISVTGVSFPVGTFTIGSLTTAGIVTNTAAGLLGTVITTGSGNVVLATSPTISTSLVAGTSSFDLLNTTATTLNFGGAATTFNLGGTPTTSLTATLFGNATASGQTKEIRIGTGGLAGSTTNINLGSTFTNVLIPSFSTNGIVTNNSSGRLSTATQSGTSALTGALSWNGSTVTSNTSYFTFNYTLANAAILDVGSGLSGGGQLRLGSNLGNVITNGSLSIYGNSAASTTTAVSGAFAIASGTIGSYTGLMVQLYSGSTTSSQAPLVIDSFNNNDIYLRPGRTLFIRNLSTSVIGLPTGAIWNNAGILSIAP